jgi:hypothetical protein
MFSNRLDIYWTNTEQVLDNYWGISLVRAKEEYGKSEGKKEDG